MSFHVCFIAKNLPLSFSGSNKENLWPVAVKLSELGVKVSLVLFKGPFNEEKTSLNKCTVYFASHGDEFVSSEDFPELSLKLLHKIHKEHPIDHIHSLDTPLRKFKKDFKSLKHRPYLSYGIPASQMEEMFNRLSVYDDSLISALKTTFLYPLYFLIRFFLQDYLMLRDADGVFVSTPKQALSLERYYLYPPEWIFKIPLDNYTSDLILRTKSSKLLEELSLEDTAPIVATASRMKSTKELYFLLDVFEQVSLLHPKAKFLILGAGPCFKEIEREVLLKALDSKVVFTRNVPRHSLPDYISLSDIFVNISSTTSGFGPTLIEAMAQEKVIIGSEFSTLSTMIKDNENGFLIRPGEIQKCVNLIDDIFTQKRDAQIIGKKAREDIIKILNRDQLTENTLNAFKKISSRGFRLFSIPFFN